MNRVCLAALLSLLFFFGCTVEAVGQTNSVLVTKQVDGFNWSPEVAVDESGNALVAWAWLTDDYSRYEIYAIYLEKKGKKYKPQTPIKISGKKIYNQYPSVAYQKLSKTFLVAWEALGDSGYSIQYLVFDNDGKPIGKEQELPVESDNYASNQRVRICAFEGARKASKSFVIAYYKIGSEYENTGLWTAVLSSTGQVTKKPRHVLPVTIPGSGEIMSEPTSLKPLPAGKGFLLGTFRIDQSGTSPIRHGFVIRLNKAGKVKKSAMLDGVDNTTIVTCDPITGDDFFTSYFQVNEGRVYNRLLNSSLATISETYTPDDQNCNAFCVVRLGERIFQLFCVSYPGFRMVEIGPDGRPLGSLTFIDTDKSISPDFAAVPLPDMKRILILTTVRNSSNPIDNDIYAIIYNVPE